MQVVVDTYVHRCIYHGKLRKNKYCFRNVAPKNLCPDLFYIAYPYCLALLYDAKMDKKRSIILSCPNPQANVKIKIKVKPIISKYLYNKIRSLAKKHWRPINFPNKRIMMKIISVDGNCPRNHKPNQCSEFNIGFFSELCPAGFHSIYPFVSLISRKMLSRFSDTQNSIKIGCPDVNKVITYKIHARGLKFFKK
jgi:uncharacterized repeat protein (TIGR04076 family)